MARYVGEGKRFRFVAEWSRASRVSNSTVARVYNTGKVSAPTLSRLGAAVGESEQELARLLEGAAVAADLESELDSEDWKLVHSGRRLRKADPIVYEAMTEPIHRVAERLAPSD
jgi:hypothetical protein